MKSSLLNVAAFLVLAALPWWLLHHAPGADALAGHESYIAAARSLYAARPLAFVALFCLAHLICSVFGVPGGCTALNIAAGAVFGFWLACLIVYPVTLLSAAGVYMLAARLRGHSVFLRFERGFAWAARHLRRHDHWALVSLRISPLLPFGAVNLFLGLLRIPFPVFLMTTTVGIFFDVTLLTSIGAAAAPDGSPQSHSNLIIAFCFLLLLFLILRMALPKPYDGDRLTI